MPAATEGTIEQVLACLRCRYSPLTLSTAEVVCPECGWAAKRDGRIISVLDEPTEGDGRSDAAGATFDEKHEVLEEHNHHPVVWELCYRRQCAAVVEALSQAVHASVDRPGPAGDPGRPSAAKVLLDIGCGPVSPYSMPRQGLFSIGVDVSLPSLRANSSVDVALHAGGGRLPLADGSVDVVVAFYALHHMIGGSVAGSWSNVESAMAEMARVCRPGAAVLVMEVCPWPPVWVAERVAWKAARRLLGDRVDFLFWPSRRLARLGHRSFPGAELIERRFSVSPLAVLPPVIGIPGVKVPRFLYPLSVRLFQWRLSGNPPTTS